MKLIISGSRHWDDYEAFKAALYSAQNEYFVTKVYGRLPQELETSMTISRVYAGEATGVDAMADRWARENEIDFLRLHAKWTRDKMEFSLIRWALGKKILFRVWRDNRRTALMRRHNNIRVTMR